MIISVSVSEGGGRDLVYKIVVGGCLDWWWYLDTCIDLFVHGDVVYPLQVGLCWPRGAPGVFQSWNAVSDQR